MMGANFRRLDMDANGLLAVTPDELAQALLDRRILLKEQLPTVIRTLEAEEQNLTPKVNRSVTNHKQANQVVSQLKGQRDKAQIVARSLVSKVKEHRELLIKSGAISPAFAL